eukprot:TRINITY_DN8668_c0_g1_i1.p1 TRINITY_DN8668_c0_g1~~TRINITY_DN8668_c0_g1_i1.p1  ORF type:complete len:358 (-),score=18.10 TRINITY_DN8668_c0_g1_i1:317-1390(-)
MFKIAAPIARSIRRPKYEKHIVHRSLCSSSKDSPLQSAETISSLPAPWSTANGRVPRNYWSQRSNRRAYFDWLHKTLGLKSMEDWYQITMLQVRKHHRGPLYMFDDSLHDALADSYPEHKFLPWRFTYVPHSFWNSLQNQRDFMDWIGNQLNIQQMKDWYSVSLEQMSKFRAERLIAVHGDSLSATLRAVYPEHEWQEWMFESRISKLEFFKASIENQRRYVKWLEEMLQIQSLESWYYVEQATIYSGRLKGTGWLELYQGNLSRALQSIYPNHEWLPWKFHSGVEDGFWTVAANRNRFVDWVSNELYLKQKEDWYRVRAADLKRIGAWGVLKGGKSWMDVVISAYPNHPWDHQKFG